jgi:glycosyltransferase involved in cell wall biosynthesis
MKIRKELGISNELLLLFVGRVSFDKGIYELLDAVDKINRTAHPPLKICFVGTFLPDEKVRFYEKLSELDIEKHVKYAGFQDDVVPYYSAADIFVLPSYHEGLPLALLEAMSTGLPVIASRVGGMSEIIEDGVNGILLPPKDVEAIIEKITWCIDNPKRMKEMGGNARSTILNQYSLRRMGEDYLHIYEKLKA